MTFEDAAAALATAANEDANASTTPASDELDALTTAREQAPDTATSTQGETAPTAPTTQQARDELGRFTAEQAAAAAAEESFTSIDPTLLPAELQATYKALQADYTRKRQADAEAAKQYQQLGSLDELQAARELYQTIQDPSNWQQLHAELTAAMEEQGLSPAQAAAAATQTLSEAAPPTEAAPDLKALLEDPELSPLAKHVQSLQTRLDERDRAETEYRAQAQAEAEQMAMVGEYQRQEMAIRQNNPSYTDQDIEAIYELSSFHNGNLLQAQSRYDAIFNDRMGRYIAAKQEAVRTPGLSSPSAGGQSTTAGPILDPDAAHKAGLAALAQLEALDS
jgi:hypothetical protein